MFPHETLLAYARLALQQTPGDASARLFRRLIEGAVDATTQELVLSWMLSTEQFDAARLWLWRNYARQLSRPYWAELSLALVQDDVETMQELLTKHADQLPMYDRIHAARRIDNIRLAQHFAFESQERHPDDYQLYRDLTEAVMETASSVVTEGGYSRRGPVASQDHTVQAHLQVTPHLRALAHPALRLVGVAQATAGSEAVNPST